MRETREREKREDKSADDEKETAPNAGTREHTNARET
jgi:hypothetical protein